MKFEPLMFEPSFLEHIWVFLKYKVGCKNRKIYFLKKTYMVIDRYLEKPNQTEF